MKIARRHTRLASALLLLPLCSAAWAQGPLTVINATAEDLLGFHFQTGEQVQYARLDLAPAGQDDMENPGMAERLQLDMGVEIWHFKAVPLDKATRMTVSGGRPPGITLELRGRGQKRLEGTVQSLLPQDGDRPVCLLAQFRPGMAMKDVCALLQPDPARDDNDAILTSLGFAGMVWAARLWPGQPGGQGPTDRLEHMELRRKLDAHTLETLLQALYAQDYCPWQAELPGIDMNFTEMPDTDTARQRDMLRQTLEYFMKSGKGEATAMLAPATMLPVLADADTPRTDVQLFTLTLRPASRNLVVDVAAYQGGEGGR